MWWVFIFYSVTVFIMYDEVTHVYRSLMVCTILEWDLIYLWSLVCQPEDVSVCTQILPLGIRSLTYTSGLKQIQFLVTFYSCFMFIWCHFKAFCRTHIIYSIFLNSSHKVSCKESGYVCLNNSKVLQINTLGEQKSSISFWNSSHGRFSWCIVEDCCTFLKQQIWKPEKQHPNNIFI